MVYIYKNHLKPTVEKLYSRRTIAPANTRTLRRNADFMAGADLQL